MGNIFTDDEIGTNTSSLSELNPFITGISAFTGGALLGGLAGYYIGKKKRTSKSRSKRKRSSGNRNRTSKRKRNLSRDRKFISKQKHEQRYKKYRKTPGKVYRTRKSKIKYTKNGQPYIILKNGRAKFIKRS